MAKSNQNVQVTVETPKIDVDHVKGIKTVSDQVRYLSSQGLTRPQIGKFFQEHLGRTIRPQHVRNVLVTPLKKQG